MNRKNIFSYFMWFLYTGAVCGSLFLIADEWSRRMGYPGIAGYVVGALWLLLMGLFVFGIHKYIRKEPGSKKKEMIFPLVAESAIAVILLAVGISLRIYGIGNAGEYAAYFETAKVAEGQVIPPVVHGAVYLYLQLLHLIFVVFGNKFLAGVCLQIALQMIAVVFFYPAVRKLSGVFSALVMLGTVMIAPLMMKESWMLSPGMLLFAIYAMVLWIVVTGVKDKKHVLYYLFAGLLTAVVCYLDVVGVSLLLFGVAGLLLRQEDGPGKRVVNGLTYVGSAMAGFMMFLWVDSFFSSVKFTNVLTAWWRVFAPEEFLIPWEMEIGAITGDVLLVLALTVGIFTFWRGRKDRQGLWIFLMLTFMVLFCTGMATTEIGMQVYVYITAAILAGTGIGGVWEREEQADQVPEEQTENSVEGSGETLNVEAPAKESRVRYIENPLPLPKKHVKKVLDFDRDLQEGMDEFDLDIADGDDFDI